MLNPPDAGTAERMRELFREHRFDKEGLIEAGIGEEMPARFLRNTPRLRELTASPTARNLLYRLFRCGWAEPEPQVKELLPGWFLDAGTGCGLLSSSDGLVRASVALTPFDDLLIANDHARKIDEENDPHAVLLVNPTTWLLYRFAIRRKAAKTLELCSGNGAIGLSAAAWSDQVVLTDLNDRAREFAEFSAALNGIKGVEYRIGDSFQPVAGEKFDLILANPPFYVTPSLKFMAVSNELGLDQFCRRLVRQATDHLNEGGFCQMLCEWVEVEGQTWENRLEDWFDGTGCDAWVVKGNTTKPDKYAQSRIRETFPMDWSSDAPRYAEWMAYYREHRLTAIHRGLIALRKRAGSNWVRIEDSPMTPNIPFGDYIEREFDIVDYMEANPAVEDWLASRFGLCPGVKMTHRVTVRDGKFQPDTLEVSSAGGVPRVLKTEPLVAGFLNRLDGTRTLDEMALEMAANVGAPVDQVRRECVDVARRLYERGFVRVAEPERVSTAGTS